MKNLILKTPIFTYFTQIRHSYNSIIRCDPSKIGQKIILPEMSSDYTYDDDPYKKRKTRFTPEEDAQLEQLVRNKKDHSWKEIAKCFPGKNAAQCRDRYNQYLFKKVVNGPWTPEEDKLIVELYREIGPHWVKISNFLPGRNGNNVKNRWNTALVKYHGIPYKESKQERRSKKLKWRNIEYVDYDPVSIRNLLAFVEDEPDFRQQSY